MKNTFDYQGAKQAGYSDEEIFTHLSEVKPDFDYRGAAEAGYSAAEINQYASSYKKEKSLGEKTKRAASQFGIAALENAALPYEAVNILAKTLPKSYKSSLYKENLNEDINDWEQAKEMGGFPGRDQPWNQEDEIHLEQLKEQRKNPEKREEFAQTETPDIGIRSLAEKVTGENLRPEGVIEHAANWLGYLKNPTNIKELYNIGMKPKELIKFFSPSSGEVLSSLGAGAGLELADQGKLGPMGTIAAAIIGDLAGHGVNKITKAVLSPKKSLANLTAKFTSPEKLDIQKSLINDFREAGIQADLGTITDSNLVKMAQSRLAQSGLTGKPLQELKQTMTNQIKEEYKNLADQLGEARFQTLHEAGEVGKEYITKLRDEEKNLISGMYSKARNAVNEASQVEVKGLANTLKKLQKDLSPGSVKSTEQKAVVDILEKMKADVFDASGNVKPAKIENLMNNKIALNEIINYEVQGGQKQLLKLVVKEIDNALLSYPDKKFVTNYAQANKRFSEHAKTFRNENVNRIITSQDPATVMNKMNTVQGMRDIGKALGNTFEGRETFESLKRLKFDEMIGKKMTDNVSEQIKSGTFSNLLKNPKDAQIVKEMLGAKNFAKLAKLQKSVGKLAQTAQKFMNASQSGTTIIDTAIIGTVLGNMAQLLAGNPWGLAKTAGGLGSAKYLTSLMGNTEFLKLVEESILASTKNDTSRLLQIGKMMEPIIEQAIVQTQIINQGER
jgi:hypothetical protein